MARTISEIQQAMIADLVAAAAAVGVTIVPSEWSDYDYRQLLTYIAAVANGTTEQSWDAFRVDVESKVAVAAPQTAPWVRAQMLKFQYDATTPQVMQFDNVNYAPYYPTVDATKQIIKYCSVVPGLSGSATVKVAKQVAGVPAALTTPEKSAAQSYVNLLTVPGIALSIDSSSSDKIYIAATIWFQGAYAAVIRDTVAAAIQGYLAAIPFNGVVLLSDIEAAIKGVPGVNDVVFTNVQARKNGTAYGSGTVLVIGVDGVNPTGNVIQRNWDTVAGYIVAETTTGHELADSLYFISE
jgi:hypothetical protein